MNAHDNRRGELIAAAVAAELTDAEREELDAMAAADPTVETEIDDARRVVGRLSGADTVAPWDDVSASEELRARVLAASVAGPRTRLRPAVLAAAAAVMGIVVGAGAVLGIEAATENSVAGPPGTLGAFEDLDFTGTPAGTEIEGGLVAHTWGTETILEMDGVPDNGIYEVVLVAQVGTTSVSGTFFGSSVTIDCRMNAALLREDVAGVEIRGSDGSVFATADVPPTI